MPVISREIIFGKLGDVGMRSLKGAHDFAKQRGDAFLEPVHWVTLMLRSDGTDLPLMVDRLQLDRDRLLKDLERGLSGLRRASSRSRSSAAGSAPACCSARRAFAPAMSSTACWKSLG